MISRTIRRGPRAFSFRALLPAFLSLLFFPRGDLSAEKPRLERPVLVRWDAVEFAWGYRLEIKSSEGPLVFQRSTRAIEMRFRLPPGDYLFRVTALNKFRKAAGSTAWRELKVEAPWRFQWSSLVPGLPLLRRGDARGFTWLGAFTIPMLLAVNEFRIAASTDRALREDAPANLFDGPGVLVLPESSRADPTSALPLLVSSLDSQDQLIAWRDRRIRNYFSLAALALLVHAVHLYYFWDYGYTDAFGDMKGTTASRGSRKSMGITPILDVLPAGRPGDFGAGTPRIRLGFRASF